MPRGDGTGPAGLGPMTGRAAGFCAGFSAQGFANPIMGRGGLGRGFGFFGGGRGRGFRQYWTTGLPGWARYNMGTNYPNVSYATPPITVEQETEALKHQAHLMQENLNALNNRIQELEKLETNEEKSKK